MSARTHRIQKRASEPVELELLAVFAGKAVMLLTTELSF